MGLGTLGAMHIGSINFINNIISSVTKKTANRQAPSGPVSPDRRISQRNLTHAHTNAYTHRYTRRAVQISRALTLTRMSAPRDVPGRRY